MAPLSPGRILRHTGAAGEKGERDEEGKGERGRKRERKKVGGREEDLSISKMQ